MFLVRNIIIISSVKLLFFHRALCELREFLFTATSDGTSIDCQKRPFLFFISIPFRSHRLYVSNTFPFLIRCSAIISLYFQFKREFFNFCFPIFLHFSKNLFQMFISMFFIDENLYLKKNISK